ncbi:MAG: NAD(P)-dependent oxidoreductase [Nitrospirae bacterium]|nr:MAG: NAD(P)-dependent oxidoreductase [Nitrospirota bacterium]
MHIGFLGAGLLGRPMAERLQAAGHQVTIYNRTQEKIADLPKVGIAVAAQPEAAIRAGACVILMLADAGAIRRMLLSPAGKAELKGRTVIQMGTIGPQESRAIQQEVQAAGGEYLEAPVLGSIAEAKTQRLLVMVGGTEAQFTRWAGLLKSFGPELRLIGPVGKAAALKLALNQLIAAEIAAFSLSVGLVQREGIPVEMFMGILRQSALFAPAFEKKLPRLLARNYADPNFSTKNLLKDLNLFLDEAKGLGLNPDCASGVRQLLQQAVAQGLADVDYSAVHSLVNPSDTNKG